MFYDHHKIKPNEVIVEDMVDNLLLRKLYGINFITPLKGLKKNILLLACDNAKNAYQEKMELIKRNDDQRLNAICELKEKLNVNSVSRIEIFDNSNLFGTYNVSGMVVFKDGLPLKNEYRKFKITNDVNNKIYVGKDIVRVLGAPRYVCVKINEDMSSLAIQPGDEIIVPAYTYTATASAAVHCGAKVVFIDIQKDGDQVTHAPEMDYEKVAAAITEKTKAIIPVDLGGTV